MLFIRQPKEASLDDELRSVAEKFRRDVAQDGETIFGELRERSFSKGQIAEISYALTRAITEEIPNSPKSRGIVPESIADLKLLDDHDTQLSHDKFHAWKVRARSSVILRYVLELAKSEFKMTKPTLVYFLKCPTLIPYFDLLLAQAAKSLYGFNLPIIYSPEVLDELSKSHLRRMFQDDGLIRWGESAKTDLHNYSGLTNTVIGLYDWISYPEFRNLTGYDSFPADADGLFDLGGGFATPDISRLIGQTFISLDLISPNEARNWDLNFFVIDRWGLPKMRIIREHLQPERERAKYLDQLKQQPWQHFDVFSDALPTQYHKYFITSFGFLSANVASHSESQLNKIEELLNSYRVTYMAVRRIVELAALGKEVTLFTYQRASEKSYRYRTILMKFKNNKLTDYKIWPLKTHGKTEFVDRRMPADQR